MLEEKKCNTCEHYKRIGRASKGRCEFWMSYATFKDGVRRCIQAIVYGSEEQKCWVKKNA